MIQRDFLTPPAVRPTICMLVFWRLAAMTASATTSTSTPSAAAAHPTQASALLRELAAGHPRTVVVYGTSLTAGNLWPAAMHKWLTANYTGKLTLLNGGLSGRNSAAGIGQLEKKVLAHHPDTVFIEFGYNDAFRYGPERNDPALSPAQARGNLERMIDAILDQNPDAEIILQTMNPAWNSPAGHNASAELRPELPAFYQVYRDVATARHLRLIDHYAHWLALQTANPDTFKRFIPDGSHPTATGIDTVVMPTLKTALSGEVQWLPETPGANPTTVDADICVYGATSAAVAAAVQAARMGRRVVMLAPRKRLGGMSSGGLGWTDLGDAKTIGGIAREFYRRIYTHYADDSAWTRQSRKNYIETTHLAPDDKRGLMYTFEPEVARRTFDDLLAEAGCTVIHGRISRAPGAVTKTGPRIREIATEDGRYRIHAAAFIDATYEGDLMAAAGVSYTIGREARDRYNENWNGIQTGILHHDHYFKKPVDPYRIPGNPASGLLPRISPDPPGTFGDADHRVQAYCFRMCLSNDPENRVPFPRPDGYDPSQYELLLRVFATGWRETFQKFDPIPNHKTDTNNHGPFSTDNIGMNYDYPDASYTRRDEIVREHVTYQQGLMYFLANDPRVPEDVRTAMSSWGLAADEFPETGHWPHQIYVREARRMIGCYVMTENDVLKKRPVPAPVGMGSYTMDSHNVQRYVTPAGTVQNEGDIGVSAGGPYQIAYGSLTPKADECTNLLVPVCVSSSHIAYGSIRMEPVFMTLGQSAAAAAVLAVEAGIPVQDLDYDRLKQTLIACRQIVELP